MERKHEGHHDQGPAVRGEATTAERAVIAHFPTADRARQAEHLVAPQAKSVHVRDVSEPQMQEELEAAHEGVSTVVIGWPAWAGLLLGAAVGTVVGALVYANRLVVAGIAPALSAGPVAVSFLGAGILGAFGWLIGALVHLFRTPRAMPEGAYEIRAVVSDDARADVERQLVEAGAADVLVMGDGANGAAQPMPKGDSQAGARGRSHHQH